MMNEKTDAVEKAEVFSNEDLMKANIDGWPSPIEFAFMYRMANALSRASVIPKDCRGNPGSVMLILLAGQELGFGPAESFQKLYVINGRIGMTTNAMASILLKSEKGSYQIRFMDDERCAIEFFRGDGPGFEFEFTAQEAKKAGLIDETQPKSAWNCYRTDMLFNRCFSRGFRKMFPDLAGGLTSTDELSMIENDITEADNTAAVTEDHDISSKLFAVGITENQILARFDYTDMGQLTDDDRADLERVDGLIVESGEPQKYFRTPRQAWENVRYKEIVTGLKKITAIDELVEYVSGHKDDVAKMTEGTRKVIIKKEDDKLKELEDESRNRESEDTAGRDGYSGDQITSKN